jgi:chemotaxis protein MotB
MNTDWCDDEAVVRYTRRMRNQHLCAVVAVAALMTGPGCDAPRPADAAPGPDPRVEQLEGELAEARRALDDEKVASDALRKSESELRAEVGSLRKSESELKAKADEVEGLQKKLTEVVGKFGDVTTEDGAVRVELVDKILFPVGEADLTPNGREVLAQVGAALKEIEDKQIWVQGHTDDSPIMVRKPKPTPPPPDEPKGKKSGKDAKPAEPPATSDAVLPFITNWELSAARALTVVHYLQDEAKIDPTRLAAVAFSQYRPSSKSKAKNRRIEIVLYPRAKISPK